MTQSFFWLRPLQLSFWIRICTAVIVLVAVLSVMLNEHAGQEEALQHAGEQSATLAHSLAQHAGDTFQMAELALVSLSRLIGSEPPTRSRLIAVTLDMRQLLRRVPRIHSLDFYEESGWRLASSQTAASGKAQNQSRAAFFAFHRDTPTAGLFVGPPVREEGNGPWLVTLSRRIDKEDGSFNGVLVATIESRYFGDFYASFDNGMNVRVVLLGPDGRLLGRNPHDDTLIGRDMQDTAVFREVQKGRISGSLRLPSPIDGVERIAAYHVVDGQNVTVVFSVSRDAALGSWRQGIYLRTSIFVLLAAAIILGGLRLARQAYRRQASEKSLLRLSLTDSLTGLANRRAFDAAFDKAWRDCRVTGRPLSLLMIDVDCFKSFNDSYGHQAGDTCLRIVAMSICDAVRSPSEQVMRYGGEEVVVILEDTGPEQAFVTAQRIRTGIAALDVPHAQSLVAGHVTVSIGCATERPELRLRTSSAELLADADRALYAAKLAGRDRVVSNEGIGLARAVTLDRRLATTGA